jgi:hopanoid biosynthesis associated radical SAM protein HpnH
MGVPLNQMVRVGAYVVRQHMAGRRRYPLVLMLEPLFRCNLACAGCGKIDYPAPILNQRLTPAQCFEAVEECGAPVVAIAGGEPLLHKEMPEIVDGMLARGKFVYLCTNALLMEKRLERFRPHKNFAFDVHLDGDQEMHDRSVSQEGVFDRAVAAIKAAKAKGFRVCINTTLFDGTDATRVAAFLDHMKTIDLDGVMISPGYAYERAPDQQHFLNRQKSKQLFRDIFRRGRGKGWKFNQSALFLDFLAGNQSYVCTPWGKPTRNVFGWQRPCYLLGEGYARTYRELMESTDWDRYGTGNYEKCADCMVHSGYEATAVIDAVSHPLKTLKVALRGPRTDGPMAPEIPLENQRPAEYVFRRHVDHAMENLAAGKPLADAAD